MSDPVNTVGLIVLILGTVIFAYRVCRWANDVTPPPWERDYRR